MVNIIWNRRKALNLRRMRVEAQLWKRFVCGSDGIDCSVVCYLPGKAPMSRIPKIIPPRSRVRLIRADGQPPALREDVGRQFRVDYYSRKDGLDCIWLVNEDGEYEQTTDRKFLLKYFDIEHLSREGSLFGRGRPRLGKIRAPSSLERLNGRSSVEAYEGAKEIVLEDDPRLVSSVVRTLLQGKRALNRAAAAYALNLRHGKAAIPALERTVANRREHPKVRGQAAESLAHNHRPESHRILRENLNDVSKDVRFWCAYSLAEMCDEEALIPLRELAQSDHRSVRGFWSVSREAKAAIRRIQKEIKEYGRQRKACLFCSKVRALPYSRKSHA
jgi:HEAT repeats